MGARLYNLKTIPVTIANTASLSPDVDLEGAGLLRIITPAALAAGTTVLTFQTSMDGKNFANLYDANGSEYTVQVVANASRSIILPPSDFVAIRFLKLRTGTAASATAQDANRTFTLVIAPL